MQINIKNKCEVDFACIYRCKNFEFERIEFLIIKIVICKRFEFLIINLLRILHLILTSYRVILLLFLIRSYKKHSYYLRDNLIVCICNIFRFYRNVFFFFSSTNSNQNIFFMIFILIFKNKIRKFVILQRNSYNFRH